MYDTWSLLHVTFYYWHWHKIQSHQFVNPFFGTLAWPSHFRQWLRVCAVKIGASYFGDLFSTCQQLLGHACHIWYSLGLKSLTHNHTTRAGPVRIRCVMRGMFERKWKGRASVPKHWKFFKWTLKIFANFDHWLHYMTCWCVILLRWCHIMAIHKCYAIRLKRKNLLSPTPDACSPLLALSVFIGAGQSLQHSEVRGSYLAWVRPVFISPLCEIKLNLLKHCLTKFQSCQGALKSTE